MKTCREVEDRTKEGTRVGVDAIQEFLKLKHYEQDSNTYSLRQTLNRIEQKPKLHKNQGRLNRERGV